MLFNLNMEVFFMEELNKIFDLLKTNIVAGEGIGVNDNTTIIPIFKTKINYFSLVTNIKDNGGNALNGSLNYEPICFLQIKDGITTIISIHNERESIMEGIPKFFEGFDLNNLIKGIKA